MNKFSVYSEPTAEMILTLLADAYKDEKKIEKILEDFYKNYTKEFQKILKQLEKDGRIDLSEGISLRDHPRVYRIIQEAENKQWDKLMEQAWIWMQLSIEESLKRTYKETFILTYKLFEPMIPQARNLLDMVDVQITDTYMTQRVLPIPWCQDGKTYSARLYSHVANFQKKLNFVLEEGINKGKGMDWMMQAWRKLTNSTAYDTARLLKTETVAMWSMATKQAYINMGIEYVEIIGDAECGGICTDYVGEAIPLREAELGDELPPYHPNCACSYIAYEEVEEIPIEETDEEDNFDLSD